MRAGYRALVALIAVMTTVAVGACSDADTTRPVLSPVEPGSSSASETATSQGGYSVVPVRAGWEAFDVGAIRYAPDGRGIYYSVFWEADSQESQQDIVFIESIGAPPTILAADSATLPDAIREVFFDKKPPTIGVSPDGSAEARYQFPSSPEEGVYLTIVNTAPQTERSLRVASRGAGYRAGWIGDHTLLIVVSGTAGQDASAQALVLDSASGETTKVGSIAGRSLDEPAYVERMVVSPEGFVLFSVDDVDDDRQTGDMKSTLYRYDVAARDLTDMGDYGYMGLWDYSPSGGMFVCPEAEESPVLVEWPLAWLKR